MASLLVAGRPGNLIHARLVQKPVFSAMLFAFAAGALLACAFFLLLFESTHLIGVGWKTEVGISPN